MSLQKALVAMSFLVVPCASSLWLVQQLHPNPASQNHATVNTVISTKYRREESKGWCFPLLPIDIKSFRTYIVPEITFKESFSRVVDDIYRLAPRIVQPLTAQ